MKIKDFVINNFGLKVIALLLALFVWGMIAGKARSSIEKTMEVNVEYHNNSNNIVVSNVRPEKVRITVKGTAKELNQITPETVKIKIDLKDVYEGTPMFFTENHLKVSEDMRKHLTIHQRMIELTIKEFMTREVMIRVRYKGRLQKGVKLLERRLTPDKVKIFGRKSEIASIDTVEATQAIDLSEITESKTVVLALKKREEILEFKGSRQVEVFMEVENTNEVKKEENDKPEPKTKK